MWILKSILKKREGSYRVRITEIHFQNQIYLQLSFTGCRDES